MKFKLFSLGLLSISAFLPFAPSLTPAASAQCVMADIAVQTAIRGSKTQQKQTNKVTQESEGSCTGNVIIHRDTQTAVTSGDVIQNRESNQRISGGPSNGTGVEMEPIKIQVGHQADVYSPAHDPDFMGGIHQRGN